MKRAYVIGPYRGPSISAVRKNIESARSVAEALWQLGYSVFCPHLNSALMDGVATDAHFLEGDLEWLRVADFAVTAPGWRASTGSKLEVEFCEQNGIRVFDGLSKIVEARP